MKLSRKVRFSRWVVLMRKLLSSRAFRCIVSLILVVVLVISWSPIRAQASALPEAAAVVTKVIPFNPSAGAAAGGAVLGSQVFGWVLLGLGLIVTTAQAIDLMHDYVEFSGELETSVYYYPDGTWSYGVDMSFVERVRNFLFDTGVLSYGAFLDASVPASVLDALAFAKVNYRYYFIGNYYKDDTLFVGGCNDKAPSFWYTSNKTELRHSGGMAVFGDHTNYKWASYTSLYISSVEIYEVGVNEPVYSTDGDIMLGQVAPQAVAIPDGYTEWHTNARPAVRPDTNEEITVLPIPLNPSTDSEVIPDGVTQPDIWQGSIADPMPEPDPDTGTDTDPDSGSGDDGSQDVPLTPDQLTPFVVDLRDFFPFCIPFDLFEFFQLLDADPVAPVFHWEIQDLAGNVYSIDIDLSAWDSTALFFRRLQLLVFTVGLAMASRKFIKW